MPALPPLFTQLVQERGAPITDHDAQAFQDIPLPGLRIIAQQAVDLLGEGVGTLLTKLGVTRAEIPPPIGGRDFAASTAFATLGGGVKKLMRGDGDHTLVRLHQRALQAIASRVQGAPPALTMAAWGADGSFGDELVQALVAFRAWRGLPASESLGPAETQAIKALLDAAPPPDLFDPDHVVTLLSQGARRIVDTAEGICGSSKDSPYVTRVDGVRYSMFPEMFGVTALGGINMLRLPGGVAYDTTTDYWKCNIFGGTVLTLAGLRVPTFQVGNVRHFPRAERFGDALSETQGWTLVKHLDHRDPADPQNAKTSPAIDEEIRSLLKSMQPGDMFFVDHPGEPGDNGGHTRICTESASPNDPDLAPTFAQARYEASRLAKNGMNDLAGGNETQFWLLRCRL